MRTAFENEGDIRGTDVLAGLVVLWREGASGTLRFSRSDATAGFELAAGELVATSASDSRFDTASILVRGGKLDAATLERIAAPEGSDRALLALQAGILTRREWRWGEKIRAVEVLSDLLTWLEGEYRFFRTAGREGVEFRLTVPRLILELFLRSRDRSLVLHHLGSVDVPLVRSETFDAEFPTFGLTADAESVVALIDGKATAARIAKDTRADGFAVERLLAALVTLGLVRPEFVPADTVRGRAPLPPAKVPEPAAGRKAASDADERDAQVDRAFEEFEAGDGPPPLGEIEAEAVSMTDAPLHAGSSGQDEPAFEKPLGLTAGIGNSETPRHRSVFPLIRILAVLGVGLAAFVWFRGRISSLPDVVAAPALSPSPSPQPAGGEVPGTEAKGAPSAEPTAVPASPTPLPARPTAPAPTRAPTRSKGPTSVRADTPRGETARPTSRQYWIDRAATDQKRAGADGKARYTIQLQMACEIGSLVDAMGHDRPSGTMWVATTPFRGRTCFRLLWGRYPTPEAAREALAGVPAFFSTPKNRPMVTGMP